MLRYSFSHHSHSPKMLAIVEGLPSGLVIDEGFLKLELSRRRKAPGRSQRQQEEDDKFEIVSGITSSGVTTGVPLGIVLENRKRDISSSHPENDFLMPGHIDYPFYYRNLGKISPYWGREWASGRGTVLLVLVGGIAKLYLKELGIKIFSIVKSVGKIEDTDTTDLEELEICFEKNPYLFHYKKEWEKAFMEEIEKVFQKGDTVGGTGEVVVKGIEGGIGYLTSFFQRLSSILAGELFSIPGVKRVEIGDRNLCYSYGSKLIDEFSSFRKRESNYQGGLEGGLTTGESIYFRIGVKPVPTIPGVEIKTYNWKSERIEKRYFTKRADCCIIKPVLVIAESMLALKLLEVLLDNFSSITLLEWKESYFNYQDKRKNGEW